MKEFIKKIALQFEASDFKKIATKDGLIETLTAWGCPQNWLKEITDSNWEEYQELIYDTCI